MLLIKFMINVIGIRDYGCEEHIRNSLEWSASRGGWQSQEVMVFLYVRNDCDISTYMFLE